MSARDSAGPAGPGNSGAGGLGNGGVGGGWGGGAAGGQGGFGAGGGRNGGYSNNTGMSTGTTWHGNTAYGRPGGSVQAYGMRDARSLGQAGMGPTAGSYSNFKTPSGQAMFGGSPVQGQSFRGMGMGQALSQAQRAQDAWQQSQRPASIPGLLGGAPTPASAPAQPVEGVPPVGYAPPAWAPPYQQMPPMYDVQPGLPPLGDVPPEVVPAPPAPAAGMSPNGTRPAGQYGSRRTGQNSSEFNKNFNSSSGYGGGSTFRQNGN